MTCPGGESFQTLLARVQASDQPHTLHSHQPTRTIDEARANLSFDPERIVKTIAFGLRGGGLVLAALRGTLRVDYAKLAALLGVSRRDLAALAPHEVTKRLGVEPGSVSPLHVEAGMALCVDADVLDIKPTLYCGFGRPDRTLELTAEALLRLASAPQAAKVGDFSRPFESRAFNSRGG